MPEPLVNCDPGDEDNCDCIEGYMTGGEHHESNCIWVQEQEQLRKPRPDYNPHIDYPERYMNPDVWSI